MWNFIKEIDNDKNNIYIYIFKIHVTGETSISRFRLYFISSNIFWNFECFNIDPLLALYILKRKY
jgi:hypothetical protein